MAPQIGWVGLGNMGRGMCKNLVEKGNLTNPLLIYNRTRSKADQLASKLGGDDKSRVVHSIEQLVRESDIIFYCLGDDESVLNTVDTIVKADVKRKLLVDCSTVHPDTTAREEKLITSAGGTFVAMPVFGAPAMADSGQLVIILSGPKEAISQVQPFCKGVMGRMEIVYADSEPRKATLLKVIGNTFIVSMVNTLSEGHVLAEKSGLGTQELHAFIEAMFPGPYLAYSGRLLSGDYYKREEPLFAVDLARKDARHAMKIAEDNDMRMRNVELGDEYLRSVKEHMGVKGDIAGIYGAKRKEAGLRFENE